MMRVCYAAAMMKPGAASQLVCRAEHIEDCCAEHILLLYPQSTQHRILPRVNAQRRVRHSIRKCHLAIAFRNHVIMSAAAKNEVIEIDDDDDDDEQEALELLIEENDADLQQALRNSMASADTVYESEQYTLCMYHSSDSFTKSARLLHWQQQVEGASLSHAIGNFDDLGTAMGSDALMPAPLHIVFQNTSYLVTQKGGLPVAKVMNETADYMAEHLNTNMPHFIVLGEAKLWFDESKLTRKEAINQVRKCYANILLDDYTLVILQPLHRRGSDGMAVYIRDGIVPQCQVCKPDWDNEARAIVIIANSKQLAIIGVYSVNGTATVDANGISRHDVRDAYDRNLEQLLVALKQHINNVVVIGDFNVTATADDANVPLWKGQHAAQRNFFNHQLLRKLQLHDVWREQNPYSRQYTYECQYKNNQGNQSRVDYALVSDSLLKQAQCTLLPLDMRKPSDHSPLWLTLNSSGDSSYSSSCSSSAAAGSSSSSKRFKTS
jgi:exonuclease III